MDNTWGIHFFQPFRHGVDVSIQAVTKYPAGHSDILLGSVTVNTEADWQTLHAGARGLGQYASPDDCWLTLRGLRTMGVRLAHQEQAGLEVARWLADRPEVARVLHPALPGAPGHEIWKRDFTGACWLFGVEFKPDYSVESTHAFVEALALFGIGASWGGFESLALPTTGFVTRTAGGAGFAGPVVRLHIGLEDVRRPDRRPGAGARRVARVRALGWGRCAVRHTSPALRGVGPRSGPTRGALATRVRVLPWGTPSPATLRVSRPLPRRAGEVYGASRRTRPLPGTATFAAWPRRNARAHRRCRRRSVPPTARHPPAAPPTPWRSSRRYRRPTPPRTGRAGLARQPGW